MYRISCAFALILLAGCAAPEPAAKREPPQGQRVYAYECGDSYAFTVELDAGFDRGVVYYPGGSARVEHVVAASGAKYEGEGVIYWSKGDEALLETPQGLHKLCRIEGGSVWEKMRQRGLDFRATAR